MDSESTILNLAYFPGGWGWGGGGGGGGGVSSRFFLWASLLAVGLDLC